MSDPLFSGNRRRRSAIERFVTTDDPGSGFTDDPIFASARPERGTANCADPELE